MEQMGNRDSNTNGSERIERFEDLVAWQQSRALTRAVYASSSQGLLQQDFGLRDQLRRASVSVMSSRNKKKDGIRSPTRIVIPNTDSKHRFRFQTK
jgi:hypothetical protein